MTLELWNTFATFGTFVVISATATAALVQLRNARASNQIAALTQLLEATQTPQFAAAEHFVRSKLATMLKDPEFRYEIAHPSERREETITVMEDVFRVGHYYENMGLLVRSGLLDHDLALNLWSDGAIIQWNYLAPFTAIQRQRSGEMVWENFEYLVVLSQDWLAAHPKGDYPADVRRIALKNTWLEADAQYAASRASA